MDEQSQITSGENHRVTHNPTHHEEMSAHPAMGVVDARCLDTDALTAKTLAVLVVRSESSLNGDGVGSAEGQGLCTSGIEDRRIISLAEH